MSLAISFVVGAVIGGAVIKWQDMQQKKDAELESRLAAVESKAENNGAGEAAEEVSD